MLGADSARQISRAYLDRRESTYLTPAVLPYEMPLYHRAYYCEPVATPPGHEIEIRERKFILLRVPLMNRECSKIASASCV